MVVQITNIGYDVTGDHSFDIQIPGAGRGIFDGCAEQYGVPGDNFDCGNRYGGCNDEEGCSALPSQLQEGCRWRYEWYQWLQADGQTNNPYVRFRRVQCPDAIVERSKFRALDDAAQPPAPTA
jgi:hypothetical protein